MEAHMQHRLATLFMVMFGSAVLLSATDDLKHLTGTFDFVGDRSCTISSTPFNNDASGAPTIISGAVFRQNAVDTGTFVLNADGTGKQTGQSTTMDISNTTVGDSIYNITEFSVPFTYVIDGDNILEIRFGGGTFTIVLGGGTGDTGTTSPRSERFVLLNPSEFIAGPSTDIEQETLTFNVPGGSSFTQYRLCTRSGFRKKPR
jgi:hypothetical protein